MIENRPISSLYPLALAEGEGVGTAYEYYAKRIVLRRWLAKLPKVNSLLVAGLPEVYGASLDFLLLAQELGVVPTVLEDRPAALKRMESGRLLLNKKTNLLSTIPETILVENISQYEEQSLSVDLVLCCEVLQKLNPDEKISYLKSVKNIANRVAIFTPNGENSAHASHSGLNSIPMTEMNRLISELNPTKQSIGYIDMPPFPPGITRTEDQREQAESGRLEAIAMWGLNFYAQAEHILPNTVRRKQSHIIYALLTFD